MMHVHVHVILLIFMFFLVIREVDGMFPFQSIHLVKKWIHHAGRQSIAILPNPPPRVTPDYVQGILEATEGINAEVSKDGNDIKVILENATGVCVCVFWCENCIVVHYFLL